MVDMDNYIGLVAGRVGVGLGCPRVLLALFGMPFSKWAWFPQLMFLWYVFFVWMCVGVCVCFALQRGSFQSSCQGTFVHITCNHSQGTWQQLLPWCGVTCARAQLHGYAAWCYGAHFDAAEGWSAVL